MDRLRNVRRWYWLVGLLVLLILLLAVGLYAYSRSPAVRHANHMENGFTALGVLNRTYGSNVDSVLVSDVLEVLNGMEIIELSYYLLVTLENKGVFTVKLSGWELSPDTVCVREQIASQMASQMLFVELLGHPDRLWSELVGELVTDQDFLDSVTPRVLDAC